MKKEDLLRVLDAMHQLCITHNWDSETERACQQIKELIETSLNAEDWNKARDAYGGYREDE